MRGILVVVLLLSLNSAFGQDQVQAYGFTAEENQYMAEQNEHMFGSEKKSYPMVWALNQVSDAWDMMAMVAINNIKLIIQDLNKIPREIVTIHRIITVYEKRR